MLENETAIRLGCFIGVFTLMALWEWLMPLRHRQFSRKQRWPANVGLSLLGMVVVRVLLPLAAVEAALLSQHYRWGLLNQMSLPGYLTVPITLLFLDFAIYLQHWWFHRVPVLWRLHRVHHSDPELDTSSALRFHPLEIGLSMVIKIFLVFLIGVPPVAVLVFEVLLNGSALFNHGNVCIPDTIDKKLRRFLVTPAMHHVHHSIHHDQMNSNFGFCLSIWDRILGTCRWRSVSDIQKMTIGLNDVKKNRAITLFWMLSYPFQK